MLAVLCAMQMKGHLMTQSPWGFAISGAQGVPVQAGLGVHVWN